jgi:hypothetical protein
MVLDTQMVYGRQRVLLSVGREEVVGEVLSNFTNPTNPAYPSNPINPTKGEGI